MNAFSVLLFLFFSLLFQSISFGQNNCLVPTISQGCTGSLSAIQSVSLKYLNGPLMYTRNSPQACDNPAEIIASNTVALVPNKAYTLTVKPAGTANILVGMSFDGDRLFNTPFVDQLSNFPQATSRGVEVSFSIPLNYVVLPTSVIRVRILSSETALSDSDICGGNLGRGELEEYVFSVKNCNLRIEAGPNDTICKGNTAILQATNFTGAVWSPSNLVVDPTKFNTSTSSLLTETTTLYYSVLEPNSRCFYIDSTRIYVDPIPKVNSFIEEVTKGNKCPYPGTILKVNLGSSDVSENGLTYQWYGKKQGLLRGENASTFTASVSDEYYATVQYKKSCQSTISKSLVVELLPKETHTINTSSTGLCEGGKVSLTSSINTQGYRYQWQYIPTFNQANRDTFSLSGEFEPQLTVSSSGIYMLYVINPQGCKSYNSNGGIEIKEAARVFPTIPTTNELGNQIYYTFCEGSGIEIKSKIQINLRGIEISEELYPLKYQWVYNISSQPLPGVNTEKNYTANQSLDLAFIVTDQYGCKFKSNNVRPFVFNQTETSITPTTDCDGRNLTLNAINVSPYSSFRWFYGTSNVDPSEIDVNQPSKLKPLKTGEYNLEVTTSDLFYNVSCKDTVSYVVKPVNKPFEIDKSVTTFCEGDNYYFFKTNLPSLDQSTIWKNPKGKEIQNFYYSDTIYPGKYVITTTIEDFQNQRRCTVKDSITLTMLPKPKIESRLAIIGDTIVCQPDSMTLEIKTNDLSSIDHFGWYLDSETFYEGYRNSKLVVKKTSNYSGVVKGKNGCFAYTFPQMVYVKPRAQVRYIGIPSEDIVKGLCVNDTSEYVSFRLDYNIYASYEIRRNEVVVRKSGIPIEGGTTYRTNLPGVYRFTINEVENECPFDTTFTLKSYAVPPAFAGNDSSICNDTYLKLNKSYSPVYSYSWTTNSATEVINSNSKDAQAFISPQLSGKVKFNLEQTDTQTGCVGKDSVEFNIIPNFNLRVITKAAECSGGDGYAKANPIGGTLPYTFQWNDPLLQTKDSVVLKSNTNYEVLVKDARGCSKTDEVLIPETFSGIIIDSIAVVSPSCFTKPNGKIELKITGNTGGLKLEWINKPQFNGLAKLENIEAGTYQLRASDTNTCKVRTYVLITPVAISSGELNAGGTFTQGVPLPIITEKLTALGNNIKYQWQKNEETACSGIWTNIDGAEALNYTPQNLTKSTCFRRTAYNGCDSVFTAPVSFIITKPLVDTIAGSGNVGAVVKLSIVSRSNFPVPVIIRIYADNQNTSFIDTTVIATSNPFSFVSKREGVYKIISVDGINVSNTAIGSAVIIKVDNNLVNAILSGTTILGEALNIKFEGAKNFPVRIIYSFKSDSANAVTKTDSLTFPNEFAKYTPKSTGTYTLIGLIDGNDRPGKATGSAKVIPAKRNATAFIQGGGEVGSKIKITIEPNDDQSPWIIELFRNDSLYQTLSLNSPTYEFVTFLPGKYYIKSINNILNPNAQHQFVIINPRSNFNPPVANIQGGGYVGSIIRITIVPNNSVGPWEIELLLNDTLYQTITTDKLIYSFPSVKPGKYRIRAINGNNSGNGEAVFIIISPIPNLNEVFVWNAVSPNNDGKNDNFLIQIPLWIDSLGFRFDLAIFDREGTFLRKFENVNPSTLDYAASNDMLEYRWNCKNENNEIINPGTYFFTFKLNEDGSKTKPTKAQIKLANRSGFIEVKY